MDSFVVILIVLMILLGIFLGLLFYFNWLNNEEILRSMNCDEIFYQILNSESRVQTRWYYNDWCIK